MASKITSPAAYQSLFAVFYLASYSSTLTMHLASDQMVTTNGERTVKRQPHTTMDQWPLQGTTQFLELHEGMFSLFGRSFHIAPVSFFRSQAAASI